MTFLLIVFVFFLLAGAQALLLALFGLRGFSYARSFSRPAAYEGEPVELIEVIRNRSPLFLPWVRVETRIPPSFGFNTKEEVEIRGGRACCNWTPWRSCTHLFRGLRSGRRVLPRGA